LKFLADENIPLDVVESLRDLGHDVRWVRSDMPGISDDEVLAVAITEDRLLISCDKDFGELVFKQVAGDISGVLLFRIENRSPGYLADFVRGVIALRNDWAGNFSVIDEEKIRMRILPSNSSGISTGFRLLPD
jgi:predicted nuclease of predicted toxin-antitoxin system